MRRLIDKINGLEIYKLVGRTETNYSAQHSGQVPLFVDVRLESVRQFAKNYVPAGEKELAT